MPEAQTLEELVAQEERTGAATDAPPEDEAGTTPEKKEEPEASPTGEDVAEPDPGSEPEGSAESVGLLEQLDELTPYKWSGKYKTAEEAAKGIQHLVEMAGRSDDEAKAYRELKKQLGDEGLKNLLAKASPQAEAPAASKLPQSYEDFETLMEVMDPKSGASDAQRERAMEAYRESQRRLFEIAADPNKTIAEAQFVKDMAERLEKLESRTAATNQRQAVEGWVQQHAGELFTESGQGKPTPLGDRVQAIFNEDPALQEVDSDVARWDMAYRLAKGEMPKPKGTRQASRQAERKATPSGGDDQQGSVAERMAAMLDQNIPDEKILEAFQVTD